MTQDRERKPVWLLIIAVVLIWGGLSDAFLLFQTSFGPTILPPVLVMSKGTAATIAYWCMGLMCGAFVFAGIALLFSKKIALPSFVAGLILYLGYITSAFLVFFVQAVSHTMGTNRPSGGDVLLSAIMAVGGGFALLMGWFAFNYLARLSRSRILR